MQSFMTLIGRSKREHGKHTDIKTDEGTYVPMEMTWVDNKTAATEYPFNISEKKKTTFDN